MAGELAGKVCMVTGATSGIGKQCAITLARAGAHVMVAGRKKPLGDTIVADIVKAGGRAAFVALDVTSEDAWAKAIADVESIAGRLDVLVNNAGESVARPIGELAVDELLFLLGVNLDSCFLSLKAALPLMERTGGVVINVSSVAGLRAAARNTIYGTSKAAVTGFSGAVAADLAAAGSNVRVLSLHPGLIWGEGVEASLGKEGAQKFLDFILPKTPLRRVGQVDDIAEIVAYLASDPAAAINGQEVTVDGGLWLSYP